MHSTKTSHVSEKDLLGALSAAQSATPEGGSSLGTNGSQRSKQRLARHSTKTPQVEAV